MWRLGSAFPMCRRFITRTPEERFAHISESATLRSSQTTPSVFDTTLVKILVIIAGTGVAR
jgi:hypothetical protein